MRAILNISVPEGVAKEIKSEVKKGGFASTSEFIRTALREYKAVRLARELHADREAFVRGKGKVLRSLAELR